MNSLFFFFCQLYDWFFNPSWHIRCRSCQKVITRFILQTQNCKCSKFKCSNGMEVLDAFLSALLFGIVKCQADYLFHLFLYLMFLANDENLMLLFAMLCFIHHMIKSNFLCTKLYVKNYVRGILQDLANHVVTCSM